MCLVGSHGREQGAQGKRCQTLRVPKKTVAVGGRHGTLLYLARFNVEKESRKSLSIVEEGIVLLQME